MDTAGYVPLVEVLVEQLGVLAGGHELAHVHEALVDVRPRGQPRVGAVHLGDTIRIFYIYLYCMFYYLHRRGRSHNPYTEIQFIMEE